MQPFKIAIVGGGITGLALAYFLEEKPAFSEPSSILLLEADRELGGKVRTLRQDSFQVELGPDSFVTTKPSALELCRRLGLEKKLLQPHRLPAYILWRKKFYPLPPGLMAGVPTRWQAILTARVLSPRGRWEALWEPFRPPKRGEEDESLAEFFTRRLGKEFCHRIAEPLFAGLYAGQAERLSLLATFPFLREIEKKGGSLLRGFGQFRRHSTGRSPFLSLSGGLKTLIEHLVRSLKHTQIITSCRIQNLTREGNLYCLKDTSGNLWKARSVALTIPAPQAGSILMNLSQGLAEALQRLRFVPVAVVTFAFRSSTPLTGTGFLVPRGQTRLIEGCTWSSLKWPGKAPEGWQNWRCFIGRDGSENLWWNWEEDRLAQEVWSELRQILPLPPQPDRQWVQKWELGMPQYEVGHLDWVKKVREESASFPGLYLTGSSFGGIGLPDCIRQAQETAQEVASWLTSGVESFHAG